MTKPVILDNTGYRQIAADEIIPLSNLVLVQDMTSLRARQLGKRYKPTKVVGPVLTESKLT